MGSYSYKKHKKSKHGKHSKKNKHHSRRKTRKMGGGSANIPCAGCRSDNTTKIGGYYLNTPLPDGGGRGGGQMGGGGGQACTQSPYQFSNGNQKGGRKGRGRGRSKMVPHKRGMRGMKGGDGSFWNFAKFWNPNTGGNILSLSDKGTSPTGLGAPLTTSGDKPVPPIQEWPAQKLVIPHAYTQGGAQMSGGGRRGVNHTRKGKGRGRGRGRGLRGGSILDDIQNIGRSIVYGAGSAINGLSGYSNKIYNANPSPTVQFPRGLGDVSKGGVAYSSVELPTVYKNSYAAAASL